MSEPYHFDVIIIGYGPVGASAAVMFAHQGLSVGIFDKAEEIYPLPRAVSLDGEIIRAFQNMGFGQSLADSVQAVRPGDKAGFVNSQRQWIFGQELTGFGPNGWPPISMFDQPEFEAFIRNLNQHYPQISSYCGEEIIALRQSEQQVCITTKNKTTYTADYCVACDGAGSTTRRLINANWQQLNYDQKWLVVDVTMTAEHNLRGDVLQVCDPARIVTYVGTKDPYRRWEFRLNEGETDAEMLKDETIHQLLASWTPRATYEIRRKAVYQFHAATADKWRHERILIAGDAAHQTPPFLGQGMNAGIRDVINLSWKLPKVIQGTWDAEVLDSYQAERAAHAQDLVEWAVSVGQLMEHLAAAELAERNHLPAPILAEQKHTSGYGQGRDAPPIRTGLVIQEQVSNDGITGYLLPQPIVNVGNSSELFDERLGEEFTLISMQEVEISASTTNKIDALFNLEKVNVSNLTLTRGKFPPQLLSGEHILLRPDKIVYGHTTSTLNLEQLLQSLCQQLMPRH